MSGTRIPSTNLKERIAALNASNASNSGGTASRATSPTPSQASSNIPAPAGALRDKIAKFERKGGVPVPRGRFGLGAPPLPDGPRRQGELVGNRIPAPARSMSGGISRAGSPTPSSALSSPGASPNDQRRSFSLTNFGSEFGDELDYTPLSSPTFIFPPDSPESTVSISAALSPESSPGLSTNGDPATTFGRPGIIRGTSFAKALEIARKAENAKLEMRDPASPNFQANMLDDEYLGLPVETPSIVLSNENTPSVTLHNSPLSEPQPLPALDTSSPESSPDNSSRESIDTIRGRDTPLSFNSSMRDSAQIEDDWPEMTDIHKIAPAESPVSDVARQAVAETSVDGVASSVEEAVPHSKPVEAVVPLEVHPEPAASPAAPITITLPLNDIEKIELTEVVVEPPKPMVAISVSPPIHDEVQPPPARILRVLPLPPTIVIAEADVQPATSPAAPAAQENDKKRQLPALPVVLPEAHEAPPPVIVINNHSPEQEKDQAQEQSPPAHKGVDVPDRRVLPVLDPDLIENNSLVTPPLTSGMATGVSITDVLNNYFTGGASGTFQPTTPPPVPVKVPESPAATLAYDGPESPATIHTAPLPQDVLSPPQTGLLSAAPSSSGFSSGSYSSTGSRPMSMIETSPSRVTHALRMRPATSKGVPTFLPPNTSQPRKSDFVYFPPTPDDEDTAFGSATVHQLSSSSALDAQDSNRAGKFTAIVHGKVQERPSAATSSGPKIRPLPATPQIPRVKRATILEQPFSPGHGELVALLQEAVLLEDIMDRGDLPTEVVTRMAEDEQRVAEETKAKEEARAKDEERKRIAFATAQLQAKRNEPTQGRLKHTFLIPLTKARSAHRKEVSTPAQTDYAYRPKSAALPDDAAMKATRAELTAGYSGKQSLDQSAAPTYSEIDRAATLPPKSSKSPRFTGFRRLGSISRPPTQGPNSRTSNSTSSTISSEDSALAVTPPDNASEFGVPSMSPADEFGKVNGSSTSFPSLSPKKSISSIGRATSFAEKMWSRARTKSGASTFSSASEYYERRYPESICEDDVAPQLPPVGPPPSLILPPIPVISPPNAPPLPEKRNTKSRHGPSSATSLSNPPILPPLYTSPAPQLLSVTPTTPAQPSPNNKDSFLFPGSSDSTRPSSWISMSSAGSLPSPFYDKALFDAFPSVPSGTPAPPTTIVNRDTSFASVINSSFDTALLSSAIHLASSHKSAAAVPQPASTNGLPTRKVSTSTVAPRRSGEATRL